MVFGWRMWKLCVVVSFGVIGAIVGAKLGEASGDQIVFAVVGGGVLGLVSWWPVNVAVSVLGGLLGAAVLAGSFKGMGLTGPAMWCLGGVTVLGCTAIAYLNRQRVVVLLTAFMGSVLLMSGLARLAMVSPALFGSLRTMISDYGIVLPFLLIVPVVMSSFYQISEIHRLRAEL